MMHWKKIGIGVILFVLAGLAYYGISPLFINLASTEDLKVADTVSSTAPVIGTVGHPAHGTARIVEIDGAHYLRYENYKTINGPDLFVYLATDEKATEFINLGRVSVTEGNVDYLIPVGVDYLRFRYALTWCKAFSVLFNSAELPEPI